MIRILVVVPYEELFAVVRGYLASIDTHDIVVDLEHFIGTDDEVVTRKGTDIIVARGMTGKALARANPTIHLVEISISASDLITALWKHREENGSKEVGIILTDTGICDPEQLRDLTGIPIRLRKAESEAELVDAIAELSALGLDTFIGGLTLCRRCEALGLSSIHIKSGEEAMTLALNQAIAAARSLNRERTRTNLVATVLNNAEDPMFAVNREGLVIAANSRASALFLRDPARSLEGADIRDFFPEVGVEAALAGQGETELIRTVGDQLSLVKFAPIAMGGERLGLLFTCRNADALREAERKIRKELAKKGLVSRYDFRDIISANAAMKTLVAKAVKYSQVDSSVFIIGETGTGKELFAQSIHAASRRASQPFVAVNCAALPEQLLESELFGYTEGSFSGAAKGGRIGLFELAHRGTIFLDEIGEMPLSLQAKILRVLQEKEIRKVGGDTVVPVDVRIISATNIDILERVRKGSFREDLYYRINLLNLAIPPLRERSEDIELLFRHFVAKYSAEAGRAHPRIDEEVALALRRHLWMGNIRELRNFCERLVILDESGRIDLASVEDCLDRSEAMQTPAVQSPLQARQPRLADRLLESGMEMAEFAASLGISRTTLWRRLKTEASKSAI